MKVFGFVTLVGFLVAGAIGDVALINAKNPPFKNELSVAVNPDHNYDPVTTTVSSIQALTWAGQSTNLNVRQNAVLLEAYWCPHCQRTIKMLYTYRKEIRHIPRIVATGYVRGTTLSQAKSLFAQEENSLGVNFPKRDVYFLLDTTENSQLVQKYPQLYFEKTRKLYSMMGEHVLAAWRRALS